MPFSVFQLAALAGVGLLAGVIGGLLGVGGSIIMIPAMAFILPGGQQHLYQASAMIVNVFVAGPAAVRHWQAGAVVRKVIRWMIPGAVSGVVLGVALSNIEFFRGANADRLAKVFALFLAYVTVYNAYRLARGNRLPDPTHEQLQGMGRTRIFSVGCTMGLAAGLTGIGGGALVVPLQQVFLRMPLRYAIANSTCTIIFSALVGSAYKNATLPLVHHVPVWDSVLIALILIPTAFAGGWLGAHLTHRLPRKPIRILFIGLLIVGAWKMWSAKSSPASPANPAPPAATQPAGRGA